MDDYRSELITPLSFFDLYKNNDINFIFFIIILNIENIDFCYKKKHLYKNFLSFWEHGQIKEVPEV